MKKDPIVEEVRKYRQAHAAKFNYDLRRIYEDLKEKEKSYGDRVVSLPPKYLVKTGTNKQSLLSGYDSDRNHLRLNLPETKLMTEGFHTK